MINCSSSTSVIHVQCSTNMNLIITHY